MFHAFLAFLVVAFASGTSLQELAYCGIVGICDPPRPFVREAIQTLIQGGVKVKLVTGDAQETAVAIGWFIDIETPKQVRPSFLFEK